MKNIKNEIICGSSTPASTIPYYYQLVNIVFRGALVDEPDQFVTGEVIFERIGKTVHFTLPYIYIVTGQSSGFILGDPMPEIFRPTAIRQVNNILITHGSTIGSIYYNNPSAGDAVTLGNAEILPDGTIKIGIAFNNFNVLQDFGGEGTNGATNSFLPGTYTYHI